jgi:predicted regulator of Ras-like GTPase activity (Roadblock/LC7/MglB family)
MSNQIPKVFYENKITNVLDDIRMNYGKLTRRGYIYGLMAVDQDAKIIAVDTKFDRQLNYWDLSSIGAALYGVARQGQDFFEADQLERATIIYNNLQLFVSSIGKVTLENKGLREVLIVLLTEKDVNIGVLILQMKRYAPQIKKEIESSAKITTRLKLNEQELKKHIKQLKKDLFGNKIGTA